MGKEGSTKRLSLCVNVLLRLEKRYDMKHIYSFRLVIYCEAQNTVARATTHREEERSGEEVEMDSLLGHLTKYDCTL